MKAKIKDIPIGTEKGDFVFSIQMKSLIGKEFEFEEDEKYKDWYYIINVTEIYGYNYRFHKSWLELSQS